jgi:hypothetical protein
MTGEAARAAVDTVDSPRTVPDSRVASSWLPEAAVFSGFLLGAAVGTALAGLHASRAHGVSLAGHVLMGVVGLLLALAAVVRAGRRARFAVVAALVAVGISVVDVGMLVWYTLSRLLGA